MKQCSKYIRLDVHEATIALAETPPPVLIERKMTPSGYVCCCESPFRRADQRGLDNPAQDACVRARAPGDPAARLNPAALGPGRILLSCAPSW